MILVRSKLKQLYKDLKLLSTKSRRKSRFGINCDNTNKNIQHYNTLLDKYIDNQLETKNIEEELTNVERGLLDIGCSKDQLKQLYTEHKTQKTKRKPFGDVSNVTLPSINKVYRNQYDPWHR